MTYTPKFPSDGQLYVNADYEDDNALKSALEQYFHCPVHAVSSGFSWRKTSSSPGSTEGPDMTFWAKDAGKVVAGAGKLIKNAHERKKEKKQEQEAERERKWNEWKEELVRKAEEEEAESHAALPNLVEQIQAALPEEETFAQNILMQIKALPIALSLSDWISSVKKAKLEAGEDHFSERMQDLIEEADDNLISDDIKKLKRTTKYDQYSKKIKKTWAEYEKNLRNYAKENYSNADEYKRFIIEDCNEDIEKMVSNEWNIDELKLPTDGNHAIAFLTYTYNKIKDKDLDNDKRKKWKKCYDKSIKQAEESFSDYPEVMALVSKASEINKEYHKARRQNAWQAKLFGGVILFIPLIECLCMESIGWGIFLAICWVAVYFFVGKALGVGDFIREIFKESKVKMIIWWLWLILTFFLLFAGEVLDFEWYHYVLTVIGSIVFGFIMITVG